MVKRRIGIRAWAAAAVCTGALAVAPSAAQGADAGSVQFGPSLPSFAFFYSADPGEANDVTLLNAETAIPGLAASGPDAIVVLDSGAPVATSSCVPLGIGAVCTSAVFHDEPSGSPAAGVSPWREIRLNLLDGADRLRIRGFESDVLIEVASGDGDDTVDARNENREHIECGPGFDTVLANSHDSVAASCEQVARRDCLPIVIGCEVEDLLPGAAVRR